MSTYPWLPRKSVFFKLPSLIQTSPCLQVYTSLIVSSCVWMRSSLGEQCPQMTKLLAVFPSFLELTVQLLAMLIQSCTPDCRLCSTFFCISWQKQRPRPQLLLKRITCHLFNYQKQPRTISVNWPIRGNRHYRGRSSLTACLWTVHSELFSQSWFPLLPYVTCFQLTASPCTCMVPFTFQKKNFNILFLFWLLIISLRLMR